MEKVASLLTFLYSKEKSLYGDELLVDTKQVVQNLRLFISFSLSFFLFLF